MVFENRGTVSTRWYMTRLPVKPLFRSCCIRHRHSNAVSPFSYKKLNYMIFDTANDIVVFVWRIHVKTNERNAQFLGIHFRNQKLDMVVLPVFLGYKDDAFNLSAFIDYKTVGKTPFGFICLIRSVGIELELIADITHQFLDWNILANAETAELNGEDLSKICSPSHLIIPTTGWLTALIRL